MELVSELFAKLNTDVPVPGDELENKDGLVALPELEAIPAFGRMELLGLSKVAAAVLL